MTRSNGEVALAAQRSECESAIEDIKSAPAVKSCVAHDAIARGLIALLRFAVAQMEIEAMREKQRKSRLWQVSMRLGPYVGLTLAGALGYFAKSYL